MRNLEMREVRDMLEGCALLSTGGGGDPARGWEMVRREYEAGRSFLLASLEELPDDASTCSVYFTGSTAPRSPEAAARFARLPRPAEPPAYLALRALERHLGRPFAALVSIEYGGLNTAVAVAMAARAGIPLLDADAAGRAVPDLQFSTYYLKGLPIQPLAVCTDFGETAVLEDVVDDFRAEDLVRALAVASGGLVATADHPSRVGDLRGGGVIPGALSRAMAVGRARREAGEAGRDAVEAVGEAGGGELLFRGVVRADPRWEDRAGFLFGEMEIEGTGAWAGSSYRIWFKNENVISWKDGRVDVTVPDLICVLRGDDGSPVLNPHAPAGTEVAVVGFPAPEEWLGERGLAILVPRFFGFDVEWDPGRFRRRERRGR
ncbi:MAG: DUF917 domain-containing protein [Bacillota bacterium]|nr:DUF917 domain-containing protein [Bacillota bacterium]MDI7250423.1 DUF917 domain-containing protein [Bacillota bacterium]